MLDRLPTELLLVIAELAAPQTAHSHYSLYADRRSWFASLASISRFLSGRLRPLVWTEIWLFGDMVSALAGAIERDPSFAAFTKRFVSYLEASALEEIGRVFPHFSNVTSMEIMGGGTDGAPLQLSVIERLHGELGLIPQVVLGASDCVANRLLLPSWSTQHSSTFHSQSV